MLVIEKNDNAKKIIKKITELNDNIFTELWLKETYPVVCIIKYKCEIPICVALLHEIDFDPLHKYDTAPLLLDYIYTIGEYRRKNYAYKLIEKIKQKNKIVGFCCNVESIKLFIKCGFSYHYNKNDMVRFPPFNLN